MQHSKSVCIPWLLACALAGAQEAGAQEAGAREAGAREAGVETLAGTVLDGETLDPVAGARITVVKPGDGAAAPGGVKPAREVLGRAISKSNGAYSVSDLPLGVATLRIEAEGYAPSEELIEIAPGGVSGLVLILFRPGRAGEVIEIVERAPPLPAPPGKTDLARKELTRIPGTRGDALTSIKSLPGVANADAQGAGPGILVIRGSAPEDSKITVDGIEIPILYHFFGLQSAIPSEFIGSLDFLPGGFGAEEGRATGGIINVTTRDSGAVETTGFAELSFINLAAYAAGPISRRHNLTYAVGLRRSAIDLVLPLVVPDDAEISFTTAPQYYDAQVRIDWQPRPSDRVTFLGLVSYDLLTLLNDTINPNEPLLTGKWENETSFTRGILSWRRTADKLENRLVAAVGTGGFRFEVGGERYLRFTGGRSLTLREDLTWNPSPRLAVRVGGDVRLQTTAAEVKFPAPPAEGSGGILANFSTAPLIEIMDEGLAQHVASAYAAVDLRPRRGTTVTPGVRFDYYDRFDQTTLTPRLAIEQILSDDWTLRLAVGSYSRPPQFQEAFQASNRPELATQYVLGADYAIAPGIGAQLSTFYTDRRRLLVQDAEIAEVDPKNAYVNRGFGRSFGAELLLRAKRERFFGWLAYTISRSDRIDGPEMERRLFDYDQTHNLTAVASYTIGGWQFGGRWQYSTGSPITPIERAIFLADLNIYIPELGPINSDRLDPAHQLDLRIDRKFQFDRWSLSLYLDVTNVYANPRTLGFQYNYDFSERQAVEELPLVPAIGVRGAF